MGKTKTNNKGVAVELKILRVLTWIHVFGLLMLITNHLLRDLNWLPLCILIIPSLAMVTIIEKEFE